MSRSSDTQSATTVNCPKCGETIELSDALSSSLEAKISARYDRKLRKQEEGLAERQNEVEALERAAKAAADKIVQQQTRLRDDKLAFERQKETDKRTLNAEIDRRTKIAVEAQLDERLAQEKKAIVQAEADRQRRRFQSEIAERDRNATEQTERINELLSKLSKAQEAEAQLKKREREVDDLRRELNLKVEEEVNGRLETVRAVAISETEGKLRLQLTDKDRQIHDLASQLKDASQKAEQGSQQAQGETLEIILEDQLRRAFPFDEFRPVAAGQHGADVLQIVRDNNARECGRILWEFKRQKNWQPAWVAKLKSDQRNESADIAVLVSQAIPANIQYFDAFDGVWVTSISCTIPVATVLRESLVQLARQKLSAEGQQTKSALVYEYLTGPRFRGRIEAIAERWTEMNKDLADEKKSTTKRWAKRETQLQTLLTSTAGIYGDLQGIAGRDVAEIEALSDTLLLEN